MFPEICSFAIPSRKTSQALILKKAIMRLCQVERILQGFKSADLFLSSQLPRKTCVKENTWMKGLRTQKHYSSHGFPAIHSGPSIWRAWPTYGTEAPATLLDPQFLSNQKASRLVPVSLRWEKGNSFPNLYMHICFTFLVTSRECSNIHQKGWENRIWIATYVRQNKLIWCCDKKYYY